MSPIAPLVRRVARSRIAMFAGLIVALVFGTGPTVGDVGGCGEVVSDLDATEFSKSRKELDCHRCRECGISTSRCARACAGSAPADVQIPTSCRPLKHDGEVCLHALDAASCTSFATFVDDVAPASPSECRFCRKEAQ